MTQATPARAPRGPSAMFHPRRVIDQERTALEPRFGAEFARRVTGGSWLVVVGAWVMVVGLIGMFVVGIAVFFATGSLGNVYAAMYTGFGAIIVGFLVNTFGVAQRSRAIKAMSARIIEFNPKVTPEGAARLIRTPQLYDRWMAQHPGFIA